MHCRWSKNSEHWISFIGDYASIAINRKLSICCCPLLAVCPEPAQGVLTTAQKKRPRLLCYTQGLVEAVGRYAEHDKDARVHAPATGWGGGVVGAIPTRPDCLAATFATVLADTGSGWRGRRRLVKDVLPTDDMQRQPNPGNARRPRVYFCGTAGGASVFDGGESLGIGGGISKGM